MAAVNRKPVGGVSGDLSAVKESQTALPQVIYAAINGDNADRF